ncbi:hypothetical protein JYU34_012263 [Plutella xylostella]|uniref:Uncharacterized protein n=1 Tax=Plutella xylostella TaxID=51655 RepID=A0ABQ7QER5_PLUXY|nr:hypothetical protein JYU34_012263 [Plutella xylostella]
MLVQAPIDHPRKSINLLIDSLSVTESSSYTVKPSSNACHIRRLSQLHGAAAAAARALDRGWGPVLFLITANLVLHLVETPYYVITDMFRKFQPCHTTVVEMSETRELVSQLLRRADSPSDALRRQLALFAEQLMLSRAEYAPLGVVTLHRPLIATVSL